MKKSALLVLTLVVGYLFWASWEKSIPSVVDSKEVAEESIPADVDFPVILRVNGGALEVASIAGRKSFPKAVGPTILGKSIRYCREKASWVVPYKITYRVVLGERWKIRFNNGRIIAKVPELSPSLPVAIDTRKTKAGAQSSCWFVPDMETRQKAFEQISPKLEIMAKSQSSKNFARQAARKTIREFLRNWVFTQEAYPNIPPDAPIKVIFPGE